MEMMKVVAPAQPVGATASSLSEKDVSIHTSGSTHDESKAQNDEATAGIQEEVPQEELEEHREQLDGRRKAIIVLALCVGFTLLSMVEF